MTGRKEQDILSARLHYFAVLLHSSVRHHHHGYTNSNYAKPKTQQTIRPCSRNFGPNFMGTRMTRLTESPPSADSVCIQKSPISYVGMMKRSTMLEEEIMRLRLTFSCNSMLFLAFFLQSSSQSSRDCPRKSKIDIGVKAERVRSKLRLINRP